MDRQAFNDCMRPHISGHHENRKLSFCTGAKLCAGKAKTVAEAEQICRDQPPKPPKERKARKVGCPPCNCDKAPVVVFEDLPCPESRQRSLNNLDTILTDVKAGMAVKTVDLGNQVVKDTSKCHKDDGVPELAKDLVGDLQDLSKRFYFKSEMNELKGKIDILRSVI